MGGKYFGYRHENPNPGQTLLLINGHDPYVPTPPPKVEDKGFWMPNATKLIWATVITLGVMVAGHKASLRSVSRIPH